MKNTEIQIFVSYKNRHELIKNEIVTPIQTGRAISDEIFSEMAGDDTGDNISKENDRYNELTAQYWVWKNYEAARNPDYVGFMHYRRQFIFDPALKHTNYLWLPGTKFYFVKKIGKDFMKHFTSDKIFPVITGASCVAFEKINISKISKQTNMRDHFAIGMPAQKAEVFDIFEEVIKQYYPEYAQTFEEFKNGTTMFCCNSFIMPKNLFFEYSEILFGVLEKVDERVDSSGFNKAELRFLGFLGEYLLSIFLMQKMKNPEFKLVELAGTYVSRDYRKIRRKLIKYNILTRLTCGNKKKYYLKKLAKFRKRVFS